MWRRVAEQRVLDHMVIAMAVATDTLDVKYPDLFFTRL